MSDGFSFPVEQLTPEINSSQQIFRLCQVNGPDLQGKFISNKPAFLYALASKETGVGINNRPRYEPAYGPGGLYYQRSKLLQDLYKKYGALASCSWSPWQILAITAIENQKFPFHPAMLHNGAVAVPYVVGYLNYLMKMGADTLEKLFGAYNAGPGCLKNEKNLPKKYIKESLEFYDSALKLK